MPSSKFSRILALFLLVFINQECGFFTDNTNVDMHILLEKDNENNHDDSLENISTKYSDYKARILEKANIVRKKFQNLKQEENNSINNRMESNIKNMKIDPASWMQYIDDQKKLNEINIPGSHDSLAYEMSQNVEKYAKCQNLSIEEQLDQGVRIFDVRLFFNKKLCNVYCCHGKGALRCNCYKKNTKKLISYDYVLSVIMKFLKKHPSETIIIAPKFESGNEELTNFCINSRHQILQEIDLLYSQNRVPQIQDVRGKIVLWDKKGNLPNGMKILTNKGVSVSENINYAGVLWKIIQKKFKITSKDKINLLKKSLKDSEMEYEKNQSLNSKKNFDYGYINYTSGFDTDLYILPNIKKVDSSVNSFLKNYNFKPGCIYGWFNGDFVDAEYTSAIFLSNFTTNNITEK